jgi:hypothetical protein
LRPSRMTQPSFLSRGRSSDEFRAVGSSFGHG